MHDQPAARAARHRKSVRQPGRSIKRFAATNPASSDAEQATNTASLRMFECANSSAGERPNVSTPTAVAPAERECVQTSHAAREMLSVSMPRFSQREKGIGSIPKSPPAASMSG